MKRILLILSAFYLLIIIACNNQENAVQNTSNSKPTKDVAKIAAWDTMALQYSQLWFTSPNYHALSKGQRDTIEYIEIDGEPRRISYKMSSDSAIRWIVFYQINGDLKLVRLREKTNLPEIRIKEAFSYLDNGTIFYSKDASRALQPGEPMSAFRDVEPVEFARSAEEMEAEFSPYWELVKKNIEDYKKGLIPTLQLRN